MKRSFDRAAMRWFFTLVALFLAAIFASIALNATTLKADVLGRVFTTAVAVGLLWFAVAFFRQRLTADEKGLYVRNLFSSFSIRWEDVAGFREPPSHFSRQGLGRQYGLGIITRDDRTLHVSLWGAGTLNQPGFADHVLAELEQMRSERVLPK